MVLYCEWRRVWLFRASILKADLARDWAATHASGGQMQAPVAVQLHPGIFRVAMKRTGMRCYLLLIEMNWLQRDAVVGRDEVCCQRFGASVSE